MSPPCVLVQVNILFHGALSWLVAHPVLLCFWHCSNGYWCGNICFLRNGIRHTIRHHLQPQHRALALTPRHPTEELCMTSLQVICAPITLWHTVTEGAPLQIQCQLLPCKAAHFTSGAGTQGAVQLDSMVGNASAAPHPAPASGSHARPAATLTALTTQTWLLMPLLHTALHPEGLHASAK